MANDPISWTKKLWQNIKGLTTPAHRERTPLGEHHKHEFIVIGLGRFGTGVAMSLDAYGHGVLAVDSDADRVQLMSQTLVHVVQLNATNIDALREIGADMFDTAVVCIGSEFEANLMTMVALRKLGVRRVITKATTVTQQEILLRVGADEVILPEHEAGVRLARRLAAIDFVDFLELSDDTGVVELVTPAQFVGQTLKEADIRRLHGLSVVAIKRGDEVIVSPGADEVMLENDILVILGKTSDCERLR